MSTILWSLTEKFEEAIPGEGEGAALHSYLTKYSLGALLMLPRFCSPRYLYLAVLSWELLAVISQISCSAVLWRRVKFIIWLSCYYLPHMRLLPFSSLISLEICREFSFFLRRTFWNPLGLTFLSSKSHQRLIIICHNFQTAFFIELWPFVH